MLFTFGEFTNTQTFWLFTLMLLTMALVIHLVQRNLFKDEVLLHFISMGMIAPMSIVGIGTAAAFLFGLSHFFFIWTPLFLIFLVTSFWYMRQGAIKPMREICKSLDQLSKGNLDAKIDSFWEKNRVKIGGTVFENKSNEIHSAVHELNSYIEMMQRMLAFVKSAGNGDLSQQLEQASEKDEITQALILMRDGLKEAAEDRQRRAWITDGIAQFAELLRKNTSSMSELSDAIISKLVKYTDSNQGGIFLLKKDENTGENILEMSGCYAYNRKKFHQKIIREGEGLVYTCYQEAEPIYLTDIPASYIAITSGLGTETPSALLLCPLKLNDEICGVLEIASFKEYPPHVRAFVEKITENIASAIISFKNHEHTLALLEKADFQALQMASQEEELRQNIEELQATQEAAERREADLAAAVKAAEDAQKKSSFHLANMNLLYKSLSEMTWLVEFDKNFNISECNEEAAQLFGLTRANALGLNLAKFITQDGLDKLRPAMLAGKTVHRENMVKDSTGHFLKAMYVPFVSDSGEFEKVVLIFVRQLEE